MLLVSLLLLVSSRNKHVDMKGEEMEEGEG